jgi:hypothetical protein
MGLMSLRASTITDAHTASSADAAQAVDELSKLDLTGNLGQAFDSAWLLLLALKGALMVTTEAPKRSST